MVHRILYVPTGEFIRLIYYRPEPDRPIFRDILGYSTYLHSTTEIWEQSDAAVTGKYETPESFLRFACSPILKQTFVPFKIYNELPDTIDVSLFEVIAYDEAPIYS